MTDANGDEDYPVTLDYVITAGLTAASLLVTVRCWQAAMISVSRLTVLLAIVSAFNSTFFAASRRRPGDTVGRLSWIYGLCALLVLVQDALGLLAAELI